VSKSPDASFESFARQALDAYDLNVESLDLVGDDWNCTFEVRTCDEQRYALRVYLPHRRSDDEVIAELAWLDALTDVPGIRVPRPLPSREGSPFVRVEIPELSERRRVALFTWISGDPLGDDPEPPSVAAFGEAAARLHDHGANFSDTKGLRTWDVLFPYGGGTSVASRANADVVTPVAEETFERARNATSDLILALQATGEPPRIVHGDLHQDNVFVGAHGVSFLDFDDCALAWPVQDLGVTMWEIGEDQATWPYRDMFRDGYERAAPWPERWTAEVSVSAAHRGLLKVDDRLREGGDDRDVLRESVELHSEAISWFLDQAGV
jgi:Ser/Thr protein kinase RdoA (MazF antagonist)